jgi:hypothetical protein
MDNGYMEMNVADFMEGFARATGLHSSAAPPRRYLWTDAFAVCNYLDLFRATGEERWRGLALRLVDQVHHSLGMHRDEEPRRGWISGLDVAQGEDHPTIGGLRIGKRLDERRRGEPYNERLELERDGQYFHYLTKWMHALNRVSRATNDPAYLRWAMELAATAYSRFTFDHPGSGQKRMYWKMSIDLRYPLVLAMGQHDPLDGMVTFSELKGAAKGNFKEISLPALDVQIGELAAICMGEDLATDDPLGLGGLLTDAWRILQLMTLDVVASPEMLIKVLDSSIAGLASFAANNPLRFRARQRLPFRELGLAIGLKGIERIRGCLDAHPDRFGNLTSIRDRIDALRLYTPLGSVIERFWLDRNNREENSWADHSDINTVMLATLLAPDEFLAV